MQEARDQLARMLQDFVSGRDQSLYFVNQIEALLLRHFRDTDLYELLGEPVACYSIVGGEPGLADAKELTIAFKQALQELTPQSEE